MQRVGKPDVQDRFGATAAWIMLNRPKIRPMASPTTGPSRTAPMMTGMCIMVNESATKPGDKSPAG